MRVLGIFKFLTALTLGAIPHAGYLSANKGRDTPKPEPVMATPPNEPRVPVMIPPPERG